MVKLPTPGGDDDIWGDLLNDFLEVSLDNANVDENERGKLKPSAVSEAGAVMETDTTTAAMQFVVDEDNMASNSATKVPTQQSVKAYVDAKEKKAIEVTVTTARATAAKVGTTSGGNYTPTYGDRLNVTFTLGIAVNTPTLNIDGSGALNIRLGTTNVGTTLLNTAASSVTIPLWYDGSSYQMFGSQLNTDTNTTYLATTAFTAVTGTTQAAAVNRGYITNNILEVNVTLPATVAIGQIVQVLGLGSGGWRVTAPAGDDIMLDGNSTGAAGYISGGQYASVTLRCIVANTTWEVVAYTGVVTTGAGYSTAKQPLDADLTALAAAGNSTILAATTASFLAEDKTKLDGIEALADVTDATNVAAAGAVMEADTTTAAMGFVVDEDDMVSNSATKIPTQQSVKAYADTKAAIADVVKLTGNQTIAGEKTFSNRSYFLDTLAIHTPDNSPTGGGVGTWAVANIASTMYFSNRSASPDLIFGASSEGGTIGLGSGDAAVDAYIKHGGTHRLLFSGGGDDSDTIRISNITDPTDAQDAVTKNYVDNSTISSNLTGNVAYRNAGLANWFTALETAHTTARNIVVIGDSIASLTSWWATKPWPWRLADLMTTHGRTPPAEATFRFAVGANMLTMTSCDGTQKSPEIGMGGWAAELTNGQKATQTAVMDGISVVYTTSPGAGSIEVRDGVGGTLLTTINTDAAAKSSNIWTSNSLSLASHTIELTSIGTTILEGVYVHNGTRNKGVRVWSASHSGYTTSQMYSNPSFALDLIDNLNPDLVIIATGTNDGAANYATYMAGMISAVQGVTSADIAIWLPYTSSVGFPAAEDAAARAYLSTVDLPIIDAGYGIPNMGARFTPDGVHPAGDTGHTLIANHVFASIGGDPIGQTANQLGLLEIDLTTKAPLENPTFTGQVTLPNQFTYANGNLFAGNIFGQPIFNMKDTGNATSQIGLSTSSVNQALLGINQPAIVVGAGSGTHDTNLFRNDVGEFRIRTATTTETGNIVFAKKFNNQTGTSYTLALTDEGKIVTMNNASANTISLPQDSAAAFTIGAEIPIINYGTGTTTIQAGTGATLVGGGVLPQNERKVVTKVAANTWHVSNASADFLIDEDNMTSDTTTKAPTQQSVKAYVDSSGSGKVTGPASATDNAIMRYDATTGKLAQNSSVLVSDTGAISFDVSSGARTYYRVAMIRDTNATVTGTLKITLPFSWTNTMLRMTIKGYNYKFNESAWDLTIGGYTYSTTPAWFNYHTVVSGRPPFSSVRLAHDGTNCVILLGITSTTWNFPTIEVSEVIASASQTSGWDGTWGMSFITDETGIAYIVTPTLNKIAATSSSSVTNNAVALFDGTSGSVIKDSTKTLPSGTIIGTTDTQTLSNKTLDNTTTATFKDDNLTLQDGTDTTKQVKFQLDGISTATIRTIRFPNGNDTLVGATTTATITNKTLTSPVLNDPVINNPTGFLTGASKITVGTTPPGSPSTGDIWIDTN